MLVACFGGPKATPQPSVSSPSPSVSVKPKPSFRPGAYIVTANDCLRIRSDPTLSGGIVACAPPASTVQSDGRSKKADGYTWLHVVYKEQPGWAATKYLSRTTASPSP
jgi:hypothetical protein